MPSSSSYDILSRSYTSFVCTILGLTYVLPHPTHDVRTDDCKIDSSVHAIRTALRHTYLIIYGLTILPSLQNTTSTDTSTYLILL